MKFARHVHCQVKNGKEQEFSTLVTKEIIPMLRKQSGFRDELTLVNKDGTLAISLWDDRKSADAYQTLVYPQVLAKLNHLIDGTPKVETYEVTATTLQPVTA